MNDHDREVALMAGIACCDSLVASVRDCIAGAMEGVEDTRREAQRDHDADMAAWNAGFAAGLLASKLFVKLASQHGEVLRDQYRELKGMDRADGN